MSGNLESYDGKLYVLNPASQAMEVKSDTLDPIIDGGLYSFGIVRVIYMSKPRIPSLLVYENGGGPPHSVRRIYGYLGVVFGQYLYANVEENIVRVDLGGKRASGRSTGKNAGGVIDGNHIYYVDYEAGICIVVIWMAAIRLIVEKPVLLASMNFENDYFYFRLYTGMELDEGEDCYDIYRFPRRIPHKLKKLQRYQHRHIKFIQFLDMTKFL